MLRSLPLFFLLFTCFIHAQDINRFDQYLVGTRVTYFMGQCGADVPEAAGRLSFCEDAGNLGVVMESRGLSGQGAVWLRR